MGKGGGATTESWPHSSHRPRIAGSRLPLSPLIVIPYIPKEKGPACRLVVIAPLVANFLICFLT